jgi:hypothetical protein
VRRAGNSRSRTSRAGDHTLSLAQLAVRCSKTVRPYWWIVYLMNGSEARRAGRAVWKVIPRLGNHVTARSATLPSVRPWATALLSNCSNAEALSIGRASYVGVPAHLDVEIAAVPRPLLVAIVANPAPVVHHHPLPQPY